MEQPKNSKSAVRLPIYIAVAICLGIFIGANMAGSSTPVISNLHQSISKFRQVMAYIENDYVDETNIDNLVETAITQTLADLDPHTVYIPAEELELNKSQLEGNFEGIGIEFNIFHDTINVVTPLSGGPSERLGLRPGDKIITVDTENVAGVGITNRDVINLLRGPKGSEVKVQIKRRGESELLDFTIIRDVIPQYSVDVYYMIDDETGYIKINRFSATTYMEFKEALNNLQKSGMSQMILDLTGNPGGYMNPAVKLADELLGGQQMIVYTKGKESRHNTQYFSEIKGDFEEGPIIVLVDEGSASASEIVSGALQDHDRALIVGRRSYGKGLVQMPIELNDGSAMRLTISRYYTPSGRCIQKPYTNGLTDYHKEYYERFTSGEVYTQDSIKVNDSLVYRTDNGRQVYGGGGIIPDYFVPLDTTNNSRYLTKLINSNTIQEFALNYYENNKSRLEKMDFETFRNEFVISEAIASELIKRAKLNGVAYVDKDYKKSGALIKNYLKAFIARSVWNNKGFFPILNEHDEIIQKALTLMNEAEALARN
ncbi:S41 family peptidase [Marinoscillum sp. MHG1-6]|uniref:S41 family peptidase n=1 Tax=Marinoscillum sp. MHG1-6 TaxID=2959627 RepID=UPI002157CBAE|nr:S41 family peptidase [Marinoscillum sp. MHG1-6]